MSFALNALNLDDLMPEALDFIHFSRHNSNVLLEIPHAQADALVLNALVLAVDAQNRRQLLKITDIESATNTEARLHLTPVYGVPVLNVQSFFRVSAERLAALVLNTPEASLIDLQFPALRILMRDVYGQLRLESDQEERGLELLLSLLLNARQEGMHPLLFDGYGLLKRSQLPGIHLVELGRTHAFPVEAWGVERLIESWTKTLAPTQAEEAWKQWNSIAGQRIFRVQSLRELEEVFLSTQSGLLFRLLNQCKASKVFCEGEHQQSVHFMQELKHAESEGKLLVLDLSSVSVDFHAWIWELLNQALRHSMLPLSNILVGNISRNKTLPTLVEHEVHQLLEQGVNVVNLHPLHKEPMADALKAGGQHLLQVNASQSTALFLSELTLGIPLLFGDFPALPVDSTQTGSQDVLAPVLPPNASPEVVCTDVDALPPLEVLATLKRSSESEEPIEDPSSTPFQAIEPPSVETAPYKAMDRSFDESHDDVLNSFSSDLKTSDNPPVLETLQAHPAEEQVHHYNSILGEMPEEWQTFLEAPLLNPSMGEEDPAPIDASEEIDSTHHIHPCLPDSMLEDVTPYLDESADSGFDEPEKAVLHMEYIIDGKEELKRKPQSTEEALEQTLYQDESMFGQDFDPYYIPGLDESFQDPTRDLLPSSLLGPIIDRSTLETLQTLSLEQPVEASFELMSSPLAPEGHLDVPDFSLDLTEDFTAEESPLALEESLEFESEGFYDDLLNEPIIEDRSPQATEDDAFLPSAPSHFNPQEQLEEMTSVFDAVQAGDVSLPVHQAVEVESLQLEDLDNFSFDLNIIEKAVHTEFNNMVSEYPVSSEDFMGHEEANTVPKIDPEDPLAGFSFEMTHEASPVVEEDVSVTAEEQVPTGMPEFLVPAYDEASLAEDDLIQSFQQELAEMDSGYVPLKGNQYNQMAPMRTLADASHMPAITPPYSLDGVPVAHVPLYEYQEPVPVVPSPTQAVVDYSPGMEVQHEVYGLGVVHSVVDIENRKVLSIVFEKAGKRLIDPTLTSVVPV